MEHEETEAGNGGESQAPFFALRKNRSIVECRLTKGPPLMKKLLWSTILIVLSANTLFALGTVPADYSEYTALPEEKNGWTPIQTGIGCIRFAPMSHTVIGLNTDFLYSCQSRAYGISLAPVLFIGEQFGLGVSGWQRVCGTNAGLSISGVLYCIRNRGMTLSFWNRLNCNHGVAIGRVNVHSETTSLYYGPYHSMDLIAVKLSARDASGVQIGLWNSAASGFQLHFCLQDKNSPVRRADGIAWCSDPFSALPGIDGSV